MRNLWFIVALLVCVSPLSSQTFSIRTAVGGGLPEGISGVTANVGSVSPVASDAAGNVYFAATEYQIVLRLDGAGMLTRVAGSGIQGYSGDGGPATGASLDYPAGLAVDASGNLYIADANNNRIRKVSGGVITTVAGPGAYAFGGDSGQATNAQLAGARGVAVDGSGNLYIADTWNHRVRKVTGGVITTVAGNGTQGYSGDDGLATSAQLNTPYAVAVDTLGNLYISDSANRRVRVVSGGNITTFAGDGLAGTNGDDRLANTAHLTPYGVAVDSLNNVYICDTASSRVRKVSGGTIRAFAGTGISGFSGDGGPAASATLSAPQGVSADAQGRVYIADTTNSRIRKVVSGTIDSIAGGGYSVGDGGGPGSALLNSPWGMAVDTAGNLYIADSHHNTIRKVSNRVVSTVAGNGTAGYSGDNGSATSAQLNHPTGVAVDALGDLYIADYGNHRVRAVSGGVITTAAGNGTLGYSGDNGPATSAQLNYPTGVAADSAGNLYIADSRNHRIRKVSNGMITTVAGNGTQGYSGDNGLATGAQLNSPIGVAVDSTGILYIADSGNHRIRKVSNGVITTIAGNGIPAYSGDNGPATGAQLGWMYSLAVARSGDVFLTDYSSHRIRVLTSGTPPCSYSVRTTDLGVVAPGGTLALSVQTGSSCPWSLTGLPAWLTVSGTSQGNGPATVNLVAGNNPGGWRTAAFTVGGLSVPVRQLDATACSGSSSCIVRSLPHLAFGEDWTTGLSAVSTGTGAGSFSINFYGNSGASVTLPFTDGRGNLSTLSDSVPNQGMKYYEAENPSVPLQAGWGLVAADESITVQAIFRRHTPGGNFYEAAVPSSEGYSAFVVPYDGTTFTPAGVQMYMGLAINNLNPSAAANLTCTARDHLGVVIPNAISIPQLPPLGHYSGFNYPALAGKQGTLTCTADTLVSAIALRAIGFDAFSTLPVIVK